MVGRDVLRLAREKGAMDPVQAARIEAMFSTGPNGHSG
jgi:hypothetical protein